MPSSEGACSASNKAALAVKDSEMPQPPNLRVGDCVQATGPGLTEETDFGHFKLRPGQRGQVTEKGIAWEHVNVGWNFSDGLWNPGDLKDGQKTFVEIAEKMEVANGYGSIADGDASRSERSCVTVLPAGPEPFSVRPYPCIEGWVDQVFVYPGCGCGPGQIRWARDPDFCLKRENDTIVATKCDWSRAFIWEIDETRLKWVEGNAEKKCLSSLKEKDGALQKFDFGACSKSSMFHFSGFLGGKCRWNQ